MAIALPLVYRGTAPARARRNRRVSVCDCAHCVAVLFAFWRLGGALRRYFAVCGYFPFAMLLYGPIQILVNSLIEFYLPIVIYFYRGAHWPIGATLSA